MKFEEWYNSYKITGLDKRTAEQVWDACKNECIKLVRQPYKILDFFDDEITKTSKHLVDRLEKEI
jgi:hypothetical protein